MAECEIEAPGRPHVCERCRRLKVRCQFDQREGNCQRCIRAGLQCVDGAGPEKQKQRESDIIRLEGKIDAVLSAMENSESYAGVQLLPRKRQRSSSADQTDLVPSLSFSQRSSTCGQKQARYNPEVEPGFSAANNESVSLQLWESSAENTPLSAESFSVASNLSIPLTLCPNPPFDIGDDTDVIGRGLLSFHTAHQLFSRYTYDMASQLPAVVLPPGSEAAQLWLSQPVLFLAVLSVGSAGIYPGLHQQLTQTILKVIADRVICQGQKSLEIVQALVVCALWYSVPPLHKQPSLCQLISMATTMAKELVGRDVSRLQRQKLGPFEPDANSRDWYLQLRRAWLGCFILSSSLSTDWEGPRHMCWTSFEEGCVESLEGMPDALLSDLVLCKLAHYRRIADCAALHSTREDWNVDLLTRDTLGVLTQGLSDLHRHMKNQDLQPLLTISKENVVLLIHEPILHRNQNIEIFRAPFALDKLRLLSPQRSYTASEIPHLYTIINSSQHWLMGFLSLEPSSMSILPSFYFVQAIYALLMLVVSTFEIAALDSACQSIVLQGAQIDLHITCLEGAFNTAAKDHGCLQADRFCSIFSQIRKRLQDSIALNLASAKHLDDFVRGSSAVELESVGGWPGPTTCADAELGTIFGSISYISNMSDLTQHRTPSGFLQEQDGTICNPNIAGL